MRGVVVNLILGSSAAPSVLEQGQAAIILVNYRNEGNDTGWDASATLQVPPGFVLTSMNPVPLGNIGPRMSGSLTFVVSASNETREASYSFSAMFWCQERHFLIQPLTYTFNANVTVRVVEPTEKKAARLAIVRVQVDIEKTGSDISDLELAGGSIGVFKHILEELVARLARLKEVLERRAYDEVLQEIDGIVSEASRLH